MMKVIAAALVVATAGCWSANARLPNVEGLTTDRPVEAGTYRPVGNPVTVDACATWVAVFFLFGDFTRHHRLVEEVLKERGADILPDARLTSRARSVPLLYGRRCSTVVGQPAVSAPQARNAQGGGKGAIALD